MLSKPNRIDYIVGKSYQVISLPNRLGKVCEKVVAEMLADWCEVHHILHVGEMRSRRQRSTIETVAKVIQLVQETWAEGKLAEMLFMDVKEAFDYVSRSGLMRKIVALGMDRHLVG